MPAVLEPHYIHVIPGDASFHKDEAITYSSDTPLAIGAVVSVSLRKKQVLALVTASVKKPLFTVKPITVSYNLPPLPNQLLSLVTWMKDYYPAPLGILAQLILPKQLPKQAVQTTATGALPGVTLPPLTEDQKQALGYIDGPGLHLLHGETGTGKTRVYIELAKRAVKNGKSVIILSPEIGLTSQLANNFTQVFGDAVVVLHSQLTPATRARVWKQILEQTRPLIVIGARSALFSPLSKVGLIVVDESHDSSYKQDQSPYYHTSTIAAKLAALHNNATLVLGSATPLVSDYYVASAKNRPIVRMSKIAKQDSTEVASVTITDLRDRAQFTKSPHLSNALITAIQESLAKKEQVLLFLNRRGTARVVFCERCGWQSTCPHCDLPLIYHGDHHIMRCHSCNFKAPSPTSCPECHNAAIIFKTIGTKAIVEEAARMFPEAHIMRFDTDNKKSERIEQHYDAIRSGQVDILVGTQTLAKGLDLPALGVVGVIIADTSLYFPDYSAEERTFQLLTQVIGRVGRGHRAGIVVIQTYSPDSPLLAAVLHKDWGTFYNKELVERRQFLFPPFCYLLKVTCRRASNNAAERATIDFASTIRLAKLKVIIEGPAPSFHQKSDNKFAWQLIIKAVRRPELTRVIKMLPSGWSYDIEPLNLL